MRAPQCEVSSTVLNFGTVAPGGSATRSFVLRSTGTADLSGNVRLDCASYAILSGGGPFTLPPGGSLSVEIRFAPSGEGPSPCDVMLGAGCPVVSLLGVARNPSPGAACEVVPPAIAFGARGVGTSSDTTFVIRSVGTADLDVHVVSPCAEFQVVSGGGSRVVPPGDSLLVLLRFRPPAGGNFVCSIALGPDCPDLSVSGSGIAPPISYAADIQPIWDAHCVACHGTSGNLDLHAGRSWSQLVDVTSFGYAPAKRVVAFDTTASVLYGKITNTGQYGGPMPQGGPLIPVSQRAKVRDWILQGAENN